MHAHGDSMGTFTLLLCESAPVLPWEKNPHGAFEGTPESLPSSATNISRKSNCLAHSICYSCLLLEREDHLRSTWSKHQLVSWGPAPLTKCHHQKRTSTQSLSDKLYSTQRITQQLCRTSPPCTASWFCIATAGIPKTVHYKAFSAYMLFKNMQHSVLRTGTE